MADSGVTLGSVTVVAGLRQRYLRGAPMIEDASYLTSRFSSASQ